MIKLLIGGSPCTYWSIAQKNNRETTAEGLGWELFKNYLVAKEKFQPDFFLYENNKSAAQAIKDQIKKELNVNDGTLFTMGSDASYIEINSALVSAQNRRRFYVHNCGDVQQPDDRGILLKDIIESGCDLSSKEKAYCLTASYSFGLSASNMLERGQRSLIAEPVRIGTIENSAKNKNHDSKQYRVYSPDAKATTLCGQGGGVGAKTGLYACPINITEEGKSQTLKAQYAKNSVSNFCCYNSTYGATGVAIPLMRVKEATNQGYVDVKAGDCVDMTQPNSKTRRGRLMKDKSNCLMTSCQYYQYCGTVDKPIYEVKDGMITIKGVKYPIKLVDGYYIIRKLTVKECCRLQTMPDDYCRAVSDSQAYKGLGNGWTAEVIIHILNGALKNIPKDEEIVVLSMYDGIGTGRYCLDKMGFKNVKYFAYEIDKYAMQISKSNYPDIIQLGDAFQVRNDDWKLEF